jgi:hypothetical protein
VLCTKFEFAFVQELASPSVLMVGYAMKQSREQDFAKASFSVLRTT